MIRRPLVPPWSAVLPLFGIQPSSVICPAPRRFSLIGPHCRGGGAIPSRIDRTPSYCAQYAEAQENHSQTYNHVQLPSLTVVHASLAQISRTITQCSKS